MTKVDNLGSFVKEDHPSKPKFKNKNTKPVRLPEVLIPTIKDIAIALDKYVSEGLSPEEALIKYVSEKKEA